MSEALNGIKLDLDQLIVESRPEILQALGHNVFVVSDGSGVKILDASIHAEFPRRTRGHEEFSSPQSFVTFITNWDPSKQMPLKGNIHNGKVRVDLNGSAPGAPCWGDHTAQFKPDLHPLIEPWITAALSQTKFTQAGFAEFVEDNTTSISEPKATDLLQIVTNLNVHRDAKFASRVDVANGNFSFTMSEEDKVVGNVVVPRLIKVCAPVYRGGVAIELVVHLRYRMAQGQLTWHVAIPGLDNILTEERNALWAKIEELSGRTILW